MTDLFLTIVLFVIGIAIAVFVMWDIYHNDTPGDDWL